VTTIIGLGNPSAGDDAAGPEAVRRLRGLVPAHVRVLETQSPSMLADLWAGTGEAIVVDAVRSGAPIGTLHRFDAQAGPLPAGAAGAASTHGFGVAETIELERAMGRLPTRLTVYGIEGSAFAPGDPMASEVRQAVSTLVEELAADYATGGPSRGRSRATPVRPP
jgi:hydrogenase maturation protease